MGPWSANINSTVDALLQKLKLGQREKDAVWAEVSNGSHTAQPAMSHRSQIGTLPPAAVFFPKAPFEGIVRTYSRAVDKKVRMKLSRRDSKGRLHDSLIESNWHATSEAAFEAIKEKCVSMGRDVPAMSHKRCDEPGVKIVHQIFGLYRDGKEMNPLFKLSSSAWRAYAKRHVCVYICWTADMVDTLIQQKAPQWLQDLYNGVRYAVQRVDVARFFILFLYGGLYADLDVFPNLEQFPQVPLGLCKMVARETKTMCRKPEWEIEVVVATKGNDSLMEILSGMLRDVHKWHSDKAWRLSPSLERYYKLKACRFIYRTTGPQGVGKTLRTKGYEPQVTVFSMNRPAPNLEKHLSFDDDGRVSCHLPGMEQYDVWSAFSMSYNVQSPRAPPPLAEPFAQLPLFDAIQKRRRYRVKTNPDHDPDTDDEYYFRGCDTPDSVIDNQPLPGFEAESDVEMELGDLPPGPQAALEDIADLFFTERGQAEGSMGCFACLSLTTREFLCSIQERRM